MNDRNTAVPSAGGIIVRDNKILMGLRKGHPYCPNRWGFPAGHMEDSESLKECAIREIHEETGISRDPNALDLLYVVQRYRAHPQQGKSLDAVMLS